MKKFMAVYVGSPPNTNPHSSWNSLSEDERNKRMAAGMKAWGQWVEDHKSIIVDNGGPLGKTKRTGPDGVSDIKNLLSGYTIVEAESHEAAARLFEKHPHFMLFPGDAVEVMEILPIPSM